MYYKLFNKLFGWDYISWNNFVHQGIARVHVDGLGKPYYWRYKNIGLADRICSLEQVMWLTCKPEKYLNMKEEDDGSKISR